MTACHELGCYFKWKRQILWWSSIENICTVRWQKKMMLASKFEGWVYTLEICGACFTKTNSNSSTWTHFLWYIKASTYLYDFNYKLEEDEENFTIQMVIAICLKMRTLKNQGMDQIKKIFWWNRNCMRNLF